MIRPSTRVLFSTRFRIALFLCALAGVSANAVAQPIGDVELSPTTDAPDYQPPPRNDQVIQLAGSYRIGIEYGVGVAAGQCLIVGNRGEPIVEPDARPYLVTERYSWSEPGGHPRWCGFASRDAFVANGQGVIELTKMASTSDPNENVYLITKDNFYYCLAPTATGVRFLKCNANMWAGTARWLIDTSVRNGSTGNTVYAAIRHKDTGHCLGYGSYGYDTQPSLIRWSAIPGDTKYCGLGIGELRWTGQAMFMLQNINDL